MLPPWTINLLIIEELMISLTIKSIQNWLINTQSCVQYLSRFLIIFCKTSINHWQPGSIIFLVSISCQVFDSLGYYLRHKRRLDPSNRYNNLDNVQHMDNLEIKMNISNWIIRLSLTKWAICENASTLIQENNLNQITLHMPWYFHILIVIIISIINVKLQELLFYSRKSIWCNQVQKIGRYSRGRSEKMNF